MAIQTATNPQTGETIALVNGQWAPVGQTATNDQGQKAYLVDNQWITDQPKVNVTLTARFHHRQKPLPVHITTLKDDSVVLQFPTPYQALTPGQGAVLYDGPICLGGGIIDAVYFQGKTINR